MQSAVSLHAARILLGRSQEEIAELAGVSVVTVRRAESVTARSNPATPVSAEKIAAIASALEAAGVKFMAENGRGKAVRSD
ncbi:MAG: hypothetical protein BGO82_05980 [Devosia sp. 67-54]|uniref:helix-turn-helix domain-containing protein n=1 Tax=unclassified Devosia TaxID=196773 RepID=UPI00095DC3F5|nr:MULTISPECIES: helix-turn-helix transcriptional regulator [unclassified Devosia]MBN9306833.1 helix-turn-helix transcriptional regulator [Devosia sp.]OJX17060.1 MAG: hypothetical protein BGO82_05980 [Devosia sp. 67-54]